MLNAYHDNLIKLISDHFGDVLQTVSSYFPVELENTQDAGIVLNTPAALIEIDMLDFPESIGDGRDSIQCNVIIHCVLGSKTENLQRELRNFAVNMLLLVKNTPVACGLSADATDIAAMPAGFSADKDGYDSWAVSFSQRLLVGESEWGGEGIIPQEVFFSSSNGEYERVV